MAAAERGQAQTQRGPGEATRRATAAGMHRWALNNSSPTCRPEDHHFCPDSQLGKQSPRHKGTFSQNPKDWRMSRIQGHLSLENVLGHLIYSDLTLGKKEKGNEDWTFTQMGLKLPDQNKLRPPPYHPFPYLSSQVEDRQNRSVSEKKQRTYISLHIPIW